MRVSYTDVTIAPYWRLFELAAITFVLFVVFELNDFVDNALVSCRQHNFFFFFFFV
jgi:hypothetical protein